MKNQIIKYMEKQKTVITIQVNTTEKQKLQDYASKHDLTVSQIIRKLIKDLKTN